MTRTITVKGIGKASAKPDYVVLTLTLESKDIDYERAMDTAADHINRLNAVLCRIGFDEESVKTTAFNVRTDYNRIKDRNGNYQQVFCGYEVTHNLKVAFDFDSARLAQTFNVLSRCSFHPRISVAFTVKDATAINEEMLRSATINAKRKAEILCESSGVSMGDLIAIDYNWGELDIYSRTRYDCCDDLEDPFCAVNAKSIDINPDDIDVSDTATFVWEIM